MVLLMRNFCCCVLSCRVWMRRGWAGVVISCRVSEGKQWGERESSWVRKSEEEMSIVPKDTIHVIAQSIGISNLQDDVAAALAPDVEYRMREIMQVGCAFHVFSQFSTPLCQVCSQCPTLPNFVTGWKKLWLRFVPPVELPFKFLLQKASFILGSRLCIWNTKSTY